MQNWPWKLFSYLYYCMLVLNNWKMSSRSQLSLHKLGRSSPIHIDAGSAFEGPTYFWHLVLLTANSSNHYKACSHTLCWTALLNGLPPSSHLEMTVQLQVKWSSLRYRGKITCEWGCLFFCLPLAAQQGGFSRQFLHQRGLTDFSINTEALFCLQFIYEKERIQPTEKCHL